MPFKFQYSIVSLISSLLILISTATTLVLAATAEEWRSRSIYQLIVDRYALPENPDSSQVACDPGRQTWCGGTWNSVRENLDYIQKAGFTAVWISPVSQNYEGPRTAYGDAYHGYWISDISKLNARFGTSQDLKALSDELHRRGMYLMVDVVVNNVMSPSVNPNYSQYFFKDPSQYHSYCPIDWGNSTSEQLCWLGDTNVALPDLKTEDLAVMQEYGTWIQGLVKEFNIDGLRIDAAKHVDKSFWPIFCKKAGVFCIGEVFDSDVGEAAQYQGVQALDSILHYPMYSALVEAFAIPGKQNMSAVADTIKQSQAIFADTTLLGNFLENQDLPRWSSFSVDQQSLYNAMVFTFMSDGIPIVYYGQEQAFHGNADPMNREPLWPSNYSNTHTYQLMSTLNQIRNYLVKSSKFAESKMQILTVSDAAIALQKGNAIYVVTNIGSPPKNSSVPVYTGWPRNTILTEVLSCQPFTVGSAGTIQMQYYLGGAAGIFISNDDLVNSGICGFHTAISPSASSDTSSSGTRHEASISYFSFSVTTVVAGYTVLVMTSLLW